MHFLTRTQTRTVWMWRLMHLNELDTLRSTYRSMNGISNKRERGEKRMWECYFQMVGEQKKPWAFSSHCESMKPCLLVRADAHSQQMGTWSLGFLPLWPPMAKQKEKKKEGGGKNPRDQVCPDVLLHLASNVLLPFGKSWWETLVGEDKSYHRKPPLLSAPWERHLPSLRYTGAAAAEIRTSAFMNTWRTDRSQSDAYKISP